MNPDFIQGLVSVSMASWGNEMSVDMVAAANVRHGLHGFIHSQDRRIQEAEDVSIGTERHGSHVPRPLQVHPSSFN